MRTILVPIFGMNELSLNAVNFAVNYAERSSAVPIFLLFKEFFPGSIYNSTNQEGSFELMIRELIHDYQVREEDQDENFLNLQEYELRIIKYVKDYDVSEIVLSSPDNNDQLYPAFLEHVESLKHTTNCRIITVKGSSER